MARTTHCSNAIHNYCFATANAADLCEKILAGNELVHIFVISRCVLCNKQAIVYFSVLLSRV